MTDAEVYACTKLIRGSRQSPPSGVPFASWTFGNLRLTDANEFLPKLDLVSRRERNSPVRLDVVVGPVIIEQWKIIPGTSTSDATPLSCLARSLFLYLRFGELYAELAHRSDVDVVVGEGAVLPDDAAHRVVWSAGAEAMTVQVVCNDAWRSALLDRDSRAVHQTPSNDSFTPGSSHLMPRATPPLAPQTNVVGSFGTSPRVGNVSAIGAFVMPTHTSVSATSPSMTFAKPVLPLEDMPPLIPVSTGAATNIASPTSAGPGGRRGLPFGIGTSTFDLEEQNESPNSAAHAATQRATFPDSGSAAPPSGDEPRQDVTAFLHAVSDFYPTAHGLDARCSVQDAAQFVMDA
jgi:hypothetical protein